VTLELIFCEMESGNDRYVLWYCSHPHGGSVWETGFVPIRNPKGRQRLYNLKWDICWSFSQSYFFSSKECTNNSSTFEGVTAGLLRVQVFWDVNLLACHPVVFYNVKAQVFSFFTQHYFTVKQIAFIFIASYLFRLLYQSLCHVKYKSNHSSVVRHEISLTYLIDEWYNVSDNKDIQIPSKHNKIYYTLPLQGYMFRLLRVIIRPSNELTQDYLIPSALWDPVALTTVGAIVLWVHVCYYSVYGYLCYYITMYKVVQIWPGLICV